MLHALGPGHGKIVITTWLATHPAKLKSSIGLTLAASLLQGLVAIALVVVVLALLQLPARQLHLSSFWLEKGSYLLVGALGLLLCWRALKKLRLLLRRPTFTAFTPHHVHNEHCGCGHQHLPAPEQLQAGDDWRARAAIVLSMGMRPCSGAIMVLLFSKVIGVFGWGMAAALAMAAVNLVDYHGAGRCWCMGSANWRSASVAIRRQRYGSRLVGRRWRWPAASYCWRRQG
ncbi:putative transmembrane protein [Klebsiella pneumoniae]|nr:putative transmembrane protein [Klebsiella pneumoniae]